MLIFINILTDLSVLFNNERMVTMLYEYLDTLTATVISKSRKALYLEINDGYRTSAICFSGLNLPLGSIIEVSVKKIPADTYKSIVVCFDRVLEYAYDMYEAA